MKKPLVVLRPGHGGSDVGFRSGSVLEKDVNLAVCMELWTCSWESGVEVPLTREEDIAKTPEERAAYANEQGADLFVSWHSICSAMSIVCSSVWIHEDQASKRHMEECERFGERIATDTGQLPLGVSRP